MGPCSRAAELQETIQTPFIPCRRYRRARQLNQFVAFDRLLNRLITTCHKKTDATKLPEGFRRVGLLSN